MPGAPVTTRHGLQLPADLKPGEYTLSLGLFDVSQDKVRPVEFALKVSARDDEGYYRMAKVQIFRGEHLEQDFFEGELAMVFAVKELGLVILSGCAHIGIVNIVKHALNMTGMSRIHAIIGGFHLVNADNTLIDRCVDDIRGFVPDYIVPTHCTGFETVMRFAREMPGQFILNTAGTRYSFGMQR